MKIFLFISGFVKAPLRASRDARRAPGPGTAGGSGVISGWEMNNNLTRNDQFSIN